MGEYKIPAYKFLSDYTDEMILDGRDYQRDIKNLNGLWKERGILIKSTELLHRQKHVMYKITLDEGQSVLALIDTLDDIKAVLETQDVGLEWLLSEARAVGIVRYKSIDDSGVIGLKELVKSDRFQDDGGRATFILGYDLEGNVRVADLAQMPHLHQPVQYGEGQAFLAFDYLEKLMQERLNKMAEKGARNIFSYNEMMDSSGEMMPRIIVIVDDISDLMMCDAKRLTTNIKIMTSMARAAGIHLVFVTQNPTNTVLSSAVTSNMTGRIAFKTTSKTQSRLIMDETGAENITREGEFYFYEPGMYVSERIQGAYVALKEIEQVVGSFGHK